jgi:hypothetical protein
MSEDRLQQECFLWFHNNLIDLRGLLFHCPNGGNRNAREGAKFKSMGVVAGVADLLFIYSNKLYAIELKTDKGTQKSTQKIWEDRVVLEGVKYFIIRDFYSFKELINNIISINGDK